MSKFPYLPQTQNQEDEYMGYENSDEGLNEEYNQDKASLYDYLDQMQQNKIQQNQSPSPYDSLDQTQPEQPYNPYYKGIKSAIAEARSSFSQTKEQEHQALNAAMRSWGEQLSKQPREKGFVNNLLTGLQSLSPALDAYDKVRGTQEAGNQSLADKMLAQKFQEQKAAKEHQEKMMKYAQEQEDRNYKRDFDQSKLQELIRHNKVKEQNGTEEVQDDTDLANMLNDAERTILTLGKSAERSAGRRFIDTFKPEGMQLSKEQATINTLGDILRGKLFNAWGYRNQAEFEHVPSISADYSMETNLETIRILKRLLLKAENKEYSQDPYPEPTEMGSVTMVNDEGRTIKIPIKAMKEALADGFKIKE